MKEALTHPLTRMEKSLKKTPANVLNNPYKLNLGPGDTPLSHILWERGCTRAGILANQVSADQNRSLSCESVTITAIKGWHFSKPLYSGTRGKAKGNPLFCQSVRGRSSAVLFTCCQALQGIPCSKKGEAFPLQIIRSAMCMNQVCKCGRKSCSAKWKPTQKPALRWTHTGSLYTTHNVYQAGSVTFWM